MGYKWGALENTIGEHNGNMGELIGNLGKHGRTHWEFGPELASSWFLQQLSSLLGLEFSFKKNGRWPPSFRSRKYFQKLKLIDFGVGSDFLDPRGRMGPTLTRVSNSDFRLEPIPTYFGSGLKADF